MKKFKYAFMVLLGASLYGTMSSFVKLSYARGFSAAEVSFAQALLAALFLGILSVPVIFRHGLNYSGKDVCALLLTGSAIGLTNYLYYLSVKYISASLAIVLLMQFTWISMLIELIVFRTKTSKQELATVALVLFGTALAGNPSASDGVSVSLKGLGLALGASMTYAAYIVANGRLGGNVRWQVKSTLIMLGSSLTIFFVNAKSISSSENFSYEFLKLAVFLAVLGTTIPTALFAAGIKKIGAGLSSILMTVELPVAVLCAHLVLNEAIGAVQCAGIFIMLAAIGAINYWKAKKEKAL